ncbi:hypothetical protein QQ054_32190 [Oscillatoria amoena NRMC-F 0135]|nr:hypothetical protein [Oscillatoria amoena NRMC-F 0135]
MTASEFSAYFENIAANHKEIEHPVGDNNKKRFAIINNPPKDIMTGEWTSEFTNAVKGLFDVRDKAGMVLEMFMDKIDELTPVDLRGKMIASYHYTEKTVISHP